MLLNSTDSETTQFPRQLDIATVCIYGLALLSGGLFLFLPFVNLLHPSAWQRWLGTLHGFASLLSMVVIVYLGHLAFPLLRGSSKILPQMRTLAFWSTFLAFLGIATGNLAYMRFRADIDHGGARAWLMENSPLAFSVFAQYHEFSSLFLLPLGVACTWILWKYGDSLLEKSNCSVLTTTCLALMGMMFFAVGGMVSGLGVAKIHPL